MSRARMRRVALAALAALLGAAAVLGLATPGPHAQGGGPAASSPAGDAALVARGRRLFVDGCSSCHGLDARGRRGQAPSLMGAGAGAADFYLSTGRMPLPNPRATPLRGPPAYSKPDIRALVAYVGSLGGPPIPRIDQARGNVGRGLKAFTERCAGCHQVVARGGIVTGAVAPPLQQATSRQVAEAVRTGPYLMPRFSPRQIDDRTLEDIARYVRFARRPPDQGGWGIGNLGPIPEGMVAWLLAGVALLIVARLIGERAQ